MKKILAGFAVFVSVLWLYSCKAAPAEPAPVNTQTATPTVTATPTITATATITPTATMTITPDVSGMSYDFEDATNQGWYKDISTPAAVNAVVQNGIGLSNSYALNILCAFSGDNDLVRISRPYTSAPLSFSGRTISVYIYVSPAMYAAGVFHAMAWLTDIGNTTYQLTSTPDFTSSGWYQAVFSVPSGAQYDYIKEIMIGVQDDSGGSYNGEMYVDGITY